MNEKIAKADLLRAGIERDAHAPEARTRPQSEFPSQASEERFRSLVELSSDWYWEQDAQYRFTRFEGGPFAKRGLEPDVFIGKKPWELRDVRLTPAEATHLRALLERREPFFDLLVQTDDGAGGVETATAISGRPVFDAQGGFRGYRGVARDVTAQARVERELVRARGQAENAERRLRTAIESLDDAFALYDADDRLVMCNERYKQYYPLSRDAMVTGAHFADIVRAGAERGEYAAAAGRVEAWIAERLEQHRRADSTVEQQLADGRWLKVSERRTPEGGIVGVRVDITALKEAQARTEAASRAKSEFVATISHEIRTPINGVLGLAELLLGSRLDDEQRRRVQTIYQSGRTLLQILNDVLDQAKIEAGRIHLEASPFDLSSVVDDAVALVAAGAADKGLEIVVHYDADAPRQLTGDAGRIQQVLGNLIGNAVKFTEHGGVHIRIAGRRLGDGRARMSVAIRDTGIGISEEDTRRLFQPFAQAESSVSRRYGGTGLGLSICRRLVELMGGEIGLSSVPGKGSEFTVVVTLPESEARRDGDTRLAGMPVLVVDDRAASRAALVARVAAFGMQAASVDLADAALLEIAAARARGRPYRVALLAHRAQGADAAALARRIRTEHPLPAIAIVALASPDASPIGAAEDARIVDAVLAQPASAVHLRAALVAALDPDRVVVVPRRRLTDPGPAKLRGKVLLAEDNAVNAQVAIAFLKRIGLEAQAVGNGLDAIDAALCADIDLVLMDLQMPVMDGLEATRHIRAREAALGRRVPIIAMTADVMPEAREASREAGIDDFVSKPIGGREFAAVVARWLGRPAPGASPAEPQSAAIVPAQLGALRESVGDSFATIVRTYLETTPRLLRDLSAACAREDANSVRRIAHLLRSSSASLGAQSLAELAQETERGGAKESAERLTARVAALVAEFERARVELEASVSQAA